MCSESRFLAKGKAACLQAAKTYLERKFEGFETSSLDELIRHALQALAASITDGELTASSCTVVSPSCLGILETFQRHLGGLHRLKQIPDSQQGTSQPQRAHHLGAGGSGYYVWYLHLRSLSMPASLSLPACCPCSAAHLCGGVLDRDCLLYADSPDAVRMLQPWCRCLHNPEGFAMSASTHLQHYPSALCRPLWGATFPSQS